MGEVEKHDVDPLGQLIDIIQQPEKRILPLLHPSQKQHDLDARDSTRSELVNISQLLFRQIEDIAKKYNALQSEKGGTSDAGEDTIPPLSGLPQLYVPEGDDSAVDAETLWGQVELQNTALQKLVKKSMKRLSKSPEDIVILDMGQLSSEDEGSDESDNEDSEDEEMVEDEDSAEEDEETRRIRERMERTMEEGESGDDDDDDDVESEDSDDDEMSESGAPKEQSPEDDLYDPVAEDMKDGFFDLNDMEDFADEEEDYLPDQGAESTSNKEETDEAPKQQKSFHQMQRDGELLHQSDNEDDDEFDDMYEETKEPAKRKKYRKDEDIDALYSMYQSPNQDDEEEKAIDMTAAEFFGRPSKKHMQRYKEKSKQNESKGDDDSWGEYDFEKEDQGGWGDHTEVDQGNDEPEDEAEGSEEEEVGESADKPAVNSKHGKQSAQLRQQTEQLEKELLAEKPWQMRGETQSTARPVNSLLEGTPEFEMASKQAPTITVEHTANIEDVIKKRILSEDWDDVVPRELPDVGWHKKRGELPEVSQEKSKLGLGELYEREYLKKAVGYDRDADEKQTEEDKAKDEMKQLFANLCSKLDALSNYHFAPRPVADEADVRPVTTPAIAMEEVLPLHVSDARGVAPEEVFATKRGREGILRGDTEMDQQDRKRLRQSKKSARRKVRKEKLADDKLISRLQPGLGLNNPYEKRKAREELSMARSRGQVTTGAKDMDGKYGSSGTFFKRLQAEAQQTIQGKGGDSSSSPAKKPKSKSSSYKL